MGLAIAAFLVTLALAEAFNRAGVFRFIDLLFDADCAWFLDGFSEGLGTGTAWGARSLVHPNPANVISPIVRAVSGACTGLGVCDAPSGAARAATALVVAPLAAAAETVFVYLTARNALGSRPLAVLVAVLNLALLPTLVFGAVPESFALTGCGFAALFYLVSRVEKGDAVGWVAWTAIGTFLTSVTATNIAPFALAHALTVHSGKGRLLPTLSRTVRLSVLVAACTAAIAAAAALSFRSLDDYRLEFQQLAEVRAPRQELRSGRWGAAALEQAAIVSTRLLFTFPIALGHTALPPIPRVESVAGLAADVDRNPREAPVRVTYRDRGPDWGTLVTLAVLSGSIVWLIGTGTRASLVFRVAALLLAFHWAFHAVFGVELFLYAKHWSVPLVILLSAWLDAGRDRRLLGAAVLSMFAVLAATRSAGVLSFILSVVS